MLVRSSMANDGVAPPTVFLVMRTEFVQTRQYDASGPVVWNLCVWQVTRDWTGTEINDRANHRQGDLSFFLQLSTK